MTPDRQKDKKKILIIDDSEIVRTTLKKVLEFGQHYDIIVAEDGIIAQKLIEYSCPDLIVLDIHMPGKGGYELFCDLKRKPETRHVKVIAISGLSGHIGCAIMQGLGADCYFEKPIDNKNFVSKVSSLLGEGQN